MTATRDARARDDAPFVAVLGTAQDGGVPQLACRCARCDAARADAARRRLVASLLVADPRTGRRWLVDATPDLRAQADLADALAPPRDADVRRAFDGVFLTHAHVGHVTGLLQLGREAHAARGLPVFGTPSMRRFLAEHEPWRQLVRGDFVRLAPLSPGQAVALGDDLSITPVPVPHRGEVTDTVAFLIAGPSRRLLYVPDIDSWDPWDRRLDEALSLVDVALLDGTFFAPDELPGRDLSTDTLARLAPLPAVDRAKVRFTHLNHSNALLEPGSAAERAVLAAGCGIARDGDVHPL